MKKTVFLLLLLCFFFLNSLRPVLAQTFGFNVHHLATDSSENIRSILSYLSQNCQTNIIRFWGYQNLGGLENIQKVLDNAPTGMQFIIALEDFPYGPAESNPKAWFGNGYRSSYRPYVQQIVSRYKNKGKILAWEIMNEPHCKGDTSCTPVLINFMNDISSLIKSIDSSTMVAPGLMGLGNVGERFGEGYDQITALPNITANSCHFYDGNAGGCQTAMGITKSKGKYFYVGEAGYIGQGSGDAGSCTSTGCTNVCSETVLTNRAALVQSNLNQLGGINAFLLWQFSPPGSSLLSCDKFSVFPNDPVCKLDGSLIYTPVAYQTSATCNLDNPGLLTDQKTSRPVPCEDCNKTSYMTSSCATSFTIKDTITFQRNEGNQCTLANPGIYVEKSWTGKVIVDPSQTIIPFVGKKGYEDEQTWLADYFEGTAYYYNSKVYDTANPEDVRLAFMQGGVWRKLTSTTTQDSYKKKMIQRVADSKAGKIKEDLIRDYVVAYNGESAKLSEFATNLPPEDISKRVNWENNTKYGRLWKAVPMFTREDTPGKIVPYLGSKIKDKFEIEKTGTKDTTIDKVPHLARLYEVTKAIHDTLISNTATVQSTANNTNNSYLLASTDTASGGQRLLAFAPTDTCITFAVTPNVNVSGSGANVSFSVKYSKTGNAAGGIHFQPLVDNNNPLGSFTVLDAGFDYNLEPPWSGDSISLSIGETKSRSFGFKSWECKDGLGKPLGEINESKTCNFTLLANNTVTSNCGFPPPPPPSCGLPPATVVSKCEKPAETGGGDTLCCDKVTTKISATDSVINQQHEPCIFNPLTGLLMNPSCNSNTISTINGKQYESYPVERQIGVALSHPYLQKIWDNAGNNLTGFFNVFRPAGQPVFEPKDASADVIYQYESDSKKGSLETSPGKFYYPYLGGLHNAQLWFLQTLQPSEPVTTP